MATAMASSMDKGLAKTQIPQKAIEASTRFITMKLKKSSIGDKRGSLLFVWFHSAFLMLTLQESVILGTFAEHFCKVSMENLHGFWNLGFIL